MKPTPRQPQPWSGQVEAAGLFFPVPMVSEAAARQRVIALGEQLAAVYRHPLGYIAVLRQPQRMDSRRAPGAVLCRRGGALCNAPPPATATSGVWLLHAGEWQTAPCDDASRVEPTAWFDLSAWQTLAVEPLGGPPPLPDALPALTRTAAEIVPGPAPAQTLQALLAKLKAAQQTAPAQPTRQRPAGMGSRLGRWLSSLVGAGSGAGRAISSTRAAPQPRRGPGWWDRLLVASQIARVLGWRQALYLRRMLAMFERGDLDEALRHAIPLATLHELQQLTQAWGLPGRRARLDISAPPAGGVSGIGLSGDWTLHLRKLYQRSFEQLDRAGRIDDALFVLAELLQNNQEAVLYLEKHGRLRQAAELAELRQLSPELQVRLWFAAGERDRALGLVRRFDVYAQVVAELERRHSPLAPQMRVLWADDAATAGNWVTAVRALWPVVEARHVALHWLRQAREQADGVLPQLLVYELAVTEQPAPVLAAAQQMLEQPGRDAAQARIALARALQDELKHENLKQGHRWHTPLAAATARALLADCAAGHGTWQLAWGEWLKNSGNAALRADLPPLPQAAPPPTGELTWTFADRGTQPIWQAVPCAHGLMLLALGEAGVALLHPDGREIHRFACPAIRLAVADQGRHAIAIMPRDRVDVLTRLDIAQRSAQAWGEIPHAEWCAADYDGQRWAVVIRDSDIQHSLLLLDVLHATPRVLWRVNDLRGLVHFIRQPQAIRLITLFDPDDGSAERWTYETPGMMLRGRDPLRFPKRLSGFWGWDCLVGDRGEVWAFLTADESQGDDPNSLRLGRFDGRRKYPEIALPWLHHEGVQCRQIGHWIAVAEGECVSVFHPEQPDNLTQLVFPGAKRFSLDLQREPALCLWVADDQGRVVAYAPDTRQLLGSWRK